MDLNKFTEQELSNLLVTIRDTIETRGYQKLYATKSELIYNDYSINGFYSDIDIEIERIELIFERNDVYSDPGDPFENYQVDLNYYEILLEENDWKNHLKKLKNQTLEEIKLKNKEDKRKTLEEKKEQYKRLEEKLINLSKEIKDYNA